MRQLLVVSQGDLSDNILAFLAREQWEIIYARAGEPKRARRGDSPLLVGLVVFPSEQDSKTELRLLQQVMSRPELRWVAALAEDQLDRLEIKRFISERLYDFQVFPIEGARLTTVLGHAYGMARIERELAQKTRASFPSRFGLVGDSAAMLSFYRMIQRAAESDVTVLITGPTGTGKEIAARAIHDHSVRAKGPYVAINCAAIPATLLQSELFGHEKGSFTNASARKVGYIQSAEGGTLFLDEIGDMPMESQATLLRFLEDKIVTPIGSTRGRHVDVRVIASTNVDLELAIQDKAFRADLYYRLAFLNVHTPTLSSRERDIELLADHFLAKAVTEAGIRNLRLSQEALIALRQYSWPGNVRELRSVIYQAALGCEGLTIQPEDLKIRIETQRAELGFVTPIRGQSEGYHHAMPAEQVAMGTLKNAREQSEKRKLEHALARNASNITRTAQDLGVSRMTLYRLMAKHGVERRASE
jgi:DNA-binding NtrC family response regulator